MEPRWAAARRIEEWAGETRVNLVRIVALVVFYGQHLVLGHWLADTPLHPGYHKAVTTLVIAWGFAAVALHACLGRRYVPHWLKYAATAWDVAMVTVLVAISGGPSSPLVVLYFLVVATAPLRLSLRLVYCGTLGAVAGYLVLLGHAKWIAETAAVPRHHQVIFALGLGVAGLLAGQVVRQARRVADGYPVSVKGSG